jgi:peptidoglycan hydrolase-like protein with peptidoglycan-binding domain
MTITDAQRQMATRLLAATQGKTLGRGSRGVTVRALQLFLNDHGQSIAADGVFGPQTQAALKAYQQQVNSGAFDGVPTTQLGVDGVAGSKTLRAIRDHVASETSPPDLQASATSGAGSGASAAVAPLLNLEASGSAGAGTGASGTVAPALKQPGTIESMIAAGMPSDAIRAEMAKEVGASQQAEDDNQLALMRERETPQPDQTIAPWVAPAPEADVANARGAPVPAPPVPPAPTNVARGAPVPAPPVPPAPTNVARGAPVPAPPWNINSVVPPVPTWHAPLPSDINYDSANSPLAMRQGYNPVAGNMAADFAPQGASPLRQAIPGAFAGQVANARGAPVPAPPVSDQNFIDRIGNAAGGVTDQMGNVAGRAFTSAGQWANSLADPVLNRFGIDPTGQGAPQPAPAAAMPPPQPMPQPDFAAANPAPPLPTDRSVTPGPDTVGLPWGKSYSSVPDFAADTRDQLLSHLLNSPRTDPRMAPLIRALMERGAQVSGEPAEPSPLAQALVGQ